MSWIAIVDDDPSVLKALARLLRAHGFQTRRFGSGHDFLAASSEGPPECLILDLQRPEMNGLELHQHLTLRGIEIPTIIITDQDNMDTRQRCETAGTVDYLFKPLQDKVLLATIAKARGHAG